MVYLLSVRAIFLQKTGLHRTYLLIFHLHFNATTVLFVSTCLPFCLSVCLSFPLSLPLLPVPPFPFPFPFPSSLLPPPSSLLPPPSSLLFSSSCCWWRFLLSVVLVFGPDMVWYVKGFFYLIPCAFLWFLNDLLSEKIFDFFYNRAPHYIKPFAKQLLVNFICSLSTTSAHILPEHVRCKSSYQAYTGIDSNTLSSYNTLPTHAYSPHLIIASSTLLDS